MKHIQTFGLARIHNLKVNQLSTLNIEQFEHQLSKFNQIVGLNYDEGKRRELIEIAVTPNQFKYLESLPLHPSQQKQSELDDGRVVLTLHLIPNFELKMQLLKMGDQIEILKPDYFRKQILDTLTKALEQYEEKKPL